MSKTRAGKSIRIQPACRYTAIQKAQATTWINKPPALLGYLRDLLRPVPMPPILAPELLAPAGTLKNMRYAFAYGADAVYAGQPRYSLRVRNNEFDHANLALGIQEAHAQGKRFYVVVNIAPHNAEREVGVVELVIAHA